jgi:hypothetical protein
VLEVGGENAGLQSTRRIVGRCNSFREVNPACRGRA